MPMVTIVLCVGRSTLIYTDLINIVTPFAEMKQYRPYLCDITYKQPLNLKERELPSYFVTLICLALYSEI